MSKEQEYWFTESGEWGELSPDTITFGPEHHANMGEAFHLASDNHVGRVIEYLEKRPHEFVKGKRDWDVCVTCDRLVEEYYEAI